ncbi:MAG: APC family permease [Flavobacteriaceae bacterium]
MAKKGISVIGAASLGIGSMVGAGIFALLGEAGAIAGSATFISFFLGGMVALSSGYSYAKLGVKFPSTGGVIEYLLQGFGKNSFSATFSILFICSGIISMAMVSKTFGTYAASLFFDHSTNLHVSILTTAVIIFFVFINFIGSDIVSKAEVYIVVIKLTILGIFMIAGMNYVNWSNFAADTFPPTNSVLGSLAITYFAYTGFAVITNTAGKMANPSKQLPRAIFLAIGFTIVLYIGLSLVVFGNLSVADVIKYKETALAEAAKPVFGAAGFILISFAALLSTASSLNANLFSTFQMSEEESNQGELSRKFTQHVWKNGTMGLLVIGFFVLVLANFVDLTTIASLGSIATLTVTAIVHIGHFKIRKETGVSTLGIIVSIVLNITCISLFIAYTISSGQSYLFKALLFLISACYIFEKWRLSGKHL